MIGAIIAQLRTGSITNVTTRGLGMTYPSGITDVNLLEPYVLVFNDYPFNSYYTVDNTVKPIIIDAHFPPGFVNELSDYIENEVIELIAYKRLTDRHGNVFQVLPTMHLSIMAEPNDDRSITGGNDDITISRYRRFIVPIRGR